MVRTLPSVFYLALCHLLPPLLSAALLVATRCLSTSSDDPSVWWTPYDGFCYRWFNNSESWFPSETACRAYGGHLVSIHSDQENRLVGRLSGCRDSWIGLFSVDFHRIGDPAAYEWTDGKVSAAGYSRFNYSLDVDPHMGAVRAAVMTWHNSHYHERYPYVCEVPAKNDISDALIGLRCLPPYVQYQRSCFWLSNFAASFVEASLHCERELSGHLASVHSRDELAFIGTLDLESDSCKIRPTWLGLISQSPCRPAKTSGQVHCFQWIDLSGELADYPEWAPGHPLIHDPTINCVSLTSEGLYSERCHVRQRCRRKAEETADTVPMTPLVNTPQK